MRFLSIPIRRTRHQEIRVDCISMKARYGALPALMCACVLISQPLQVLAFGAWELPIHIQWCERNTGQPDCPDRYRALGVADCLGHGNRACLMRKARASAENGDCFHAYQLTLTCQCAASQESARDSIRAAQPDGVCGYLKSHDFPSSEKAKR